MSLATAVRYHLPEQQAAFVGLLTRPLVTPTADPELHALISRHRATLERWATRAAYRLVNVGAAYRLRRVPLTGTVARPDIDPAPPGRELVLALVIAAALEDHSADSLTLQEISDATRRLTAAAGLRPYDPDRRAHRLALVSAVSRLGALGVLTKHTERADLLRTWEDDGTGVGAGYVIDRDALVVLVDPYELDLALTPPEPSAEEDARGARILRILLETQSVALAELTEGERAYLVGQRSRLLHQAHEMTGGVVEPRADSLTLVLPGEGRFADAATIRFPGVSTGEWVALRLLDDATRLAVPMPERVGFRHVTAAVMDTIVRTAYADLQGRLTLDLRDNPGALRATGQKHLRDAGLIDVDADGGWILRPAAARYRAADLDAAEPPGPLSADPAPAPGVRPPDVRRAPPPSREPMATQDALFGQWP